MMLSGCLDEAAPAILALDVARVKARVAARRYCGNQELRRDLATASRCGAKAASLKSIV
jgi:hypothetical protein